MGMLPRAPGGFRFLFVTIDMFTKWMEAMPVVNITHEALVKFPQSIILRFGVPKWVIIDNDTQFKGAKFTRCCADFGIEHQASLVAHPEMNDQVEHANRLILEGMKTRMFHDLEAKGRNWHKELPSILWGLCTNVIEQPETLCFTWYTEQTQYCHQKYILNQLRWCSSMRQIKSKQESLMQIS
jgi:hypothetical protein